MATVFRHRQIKFQPDSFLKFAFETRRHRFKKAGIGLQVLDNAIKRFQPGPRLEGQAFQQPTPASCISKSSLRHSSEIR